MAEKKRVIIVGFDGMDKRKIEEFGCKELQQEHFGKIDLKDLELKTPLLWSKFITGKEDTGIDFMQAQSKENAQKWDRRIARFLEKFGRKGFYLRRFIGAQIFGSTDITPDRRFMKVKSFFEQVEDSKAIQIPGYSEYTALKKTRIGLALGEDAAYSKETIRRDIEMEYRTRVREFFRALDKDYRLVMVHLHKPDFYGHMFPTDSIEDSMEIAEMYKEMDNLAGKVRDIAGENDLVVFLSDHGMEEGAHSPYAFYSTNKDLGLKSPEIVDFHPKILEFLGEK
ncbi:MAG: alkaline phosphatase family protein [Candidatus Nanohaloarchaea archaeon]|nr:alkaline phosphatase family protein [Candidatus Nanohaloarchaea archaeon]